MSLSYTKSASASVSNTSSSSLHNRDKDSEMTFTTRDSISLFFSLSCVFVESLHAVSMIHIWLIFLCSLVRHLRHLSPFVRPDGANGPKNNRPPQSTNTHTHTHALGLSPASSQPSFPIPDMHEAHVENSPLISSSPPGNPHFNNSLSAEDSIWRFYAHHHPSSCLSLISHHPIETEAKTWKRQHISLSISFLFYVSQNVSGLFVL